MTRKVLYFKDIKKEQEFKVSKYRLTREVIIAYCKAVGEKNPLFIDIALAKREGFPALPAPPTMAVVYAMKGFLEEVEMPVGGFHANQAFEFKHPAMAGDDLTTTTKVFDKFETKGEKHVIVEAVTKNQNGHEIVRSRMDAIWPS